MSRPYYIEYTTAIVIIAPYEVQEIAVPIMQRYAPDALTLLPAHITLLFPFVKYDKLDAAGDTLRDLCAQIAPFEVTLDGYGAFPQTTYMQIADPVALKAVLAQLTAAFPHFLPYGGAHGSDLVPHLTVAKFTDERQQNAAALPSYKPITFRVERLHLTYGVHGVQLPWITYEVLKLGR